MAMGERDRRFSESANDIAVDSVGNLYIADTEKQQDRRVDPVSAFHFHGSNQHSLKQPAGVSIDNADNLYIGLRNNQIEKLSLTSGTVTVVAEKKTASTTQLTQR